MRHRKLRTKLGRTGPHRKAMLRNLATALIRHEEIRTTVVKAKALRVFVAKLITLAKRQDLASRRRVVQLLQQKDATRKLFDTIGPRFENRQGGYTRIYRLEPRLGDGASMALIEFLDRPSGEDEIEKKVGLRERLFGGRKA